MILPRPWKWMLMPAALVLVASAQAHEGEHEGHHEEGVVELAAEQVKAAGIRTEVVRKRKLPEIIRAPAEIRFHGYRMADITARAGGIVTARHARLGDRVEAGAPLLVLQSPALARAEAAWLEAKAARTRARADYARAKRLAPERIVSAAQLLAAQSAYEAAEARLAAARARLAAFGLSEADLQQLLHSSRPRYGELVLRAPIAGRIVQDAARLGMHAAAGALLMQIADERVLWAEAHVPPEARARVHEGAEARVRTKDGQVFSARVATVEHRLDPTTRTLLVRLEVQNRDDLLHPGMFVEAEIAAPIARKALAIPASAIMRMGGEDFVFVQEGEGRFARREIVTGPAHMGWVEVKAGLAAGERVVVAGAFALASELAKGGFAAHQH